MIKSLMAMTLVTAGFLAAATAGHAQNKADQGKMEYESNCAACHGVDGRGEGPYKMYLTTPPADLSLLAKNNGGVFPVERVYQMIDGRTGVKGHGPSDMPIWGDKYKIRAAEHYVDVPYNPEVYIRSRILGLVDYLYRLQRK